MNNTVVEHWYKVPKTVRDKAKQNGLSNCPSEIALRPQVGSDVEQALSTDLKKKSLGFVTKKVQETICGVNYDDNCDRAKRQKVSRAADRPDLFPDYIFSTLPSQVVTMLQRAFSDINDPDEEDLEAFLKSHSVTA